MSLTSKTEKPSKTKKPSKMKKPSKTKKRSLKKKATTKFCKTCGQDILENEIRDMFMYKDTYHQLQVKEYCEEHELVYSSHKCKPHWCGDCDYLIDYEITIDHSKWDK